MRVGSQFGPYTIVAPLGAGGMGEVYRAHDTKLGRDVALKILPVHFGANPEREARFTREARVLATLNHPHIGTLYGLAECDHRTALVLELVEGTTLADTLIHGPLPLETALTIARQLADALESAHAVDVVHRDLKPANIMLRGPADGSGPPHVKVLDFGLAKIVGNPSTADVTRSGLGATAEGRVLGTPAYMSPEQARGLTVDKRTDIWAVGCVLYEMLVGRPPFSGNTATDTILSILQREPEWAAMPAATPSSVRRLIERCLRKDPHRRFHDISDVRIEIEDAQAQPSADDGGVFEGGRRGGWRERLSWSLAALAVVVCALLGALLVQHRTATPAVGRLEFTIDSPENWSLVSDASGDAAAYAVSPDGAHIVVVAFSQGTSMLWVRGVTRPPWRQLAGTEGGTAPFWSPDSRYIGFMTENTLKTVSVAGGIPTELCPVAGGCGGAWSRSGKIVFGSQASLHTVPSSGGASTAATALSSGDISHCWPSLLPDDDHVLYLAQRSGGSELRVGSLAGADTRSLGLFESNAIYTNGHLIFVRDGRLTAEPFDPGTLQLQGKSRTLADRTAVVLPWQRGLFSVSQTGVLAYSVSGRPLSQLTWIDRSTRTRSPAADPGTYINLDLSPDDLRVAVSQLTEAPGQDPSVDIRVLNLAREGLATRLTAGADRRFDPAWSHDGSQIAFTAMASDGSFAIYRHRSDGTGQDHLVVKSPATLSAPTWSPDDALIYAQMDPTAGKADLWALGPAADRPVRILNTPYDESSPAFSPNGHWIAYQSNVSGRDEVYISAYPMSRDGAEHIRVSQRGGRAPRWRGDDRELFFLAPDGHLMAASIDLMKRKAYPSLPQPLFETHLSTPGNQRPYAVASNGRRFLIPVPLETPAAHTLTLVLNWLTPVSR